MLYSGARLLYHILTLCFCFSTVKVLLVARLAGRLTKLTTLEWHVSFFFLFADFFNSVSVDTCLNFSHGNPGENRGNRERNFSNTEKQRWEGEVAALTVSATMDQLVPSCVCLSAMSVALYLKTNQYLVLFPHFVYAYVKYNLKTTVLLLF